MTQKLRLCQTDVYFTALLLENWKYTNQNIYFIKKFRSLLGKNVKRLNNKKWQTFSYKNAFNIMWNKNCVSVKNKPTLLRSFRSIRNSTMKLYISLKNFFFFLNIKRLHNNKCYTFSYENSLKMIWHYNCVSVKLAFSLVRYFWRN